MFDVTVCDYGIGNLFNVYRALEFLKIDFNVDSDGSKLGKSEKILIPGVAAFGEGISNLKKSGQFEAIQNQDKKGATIIGLCLGAQMLFQESEEAFGIPGLGLIEGTVKNLNSQVTKSPHQGWSELVLSKSSSDTLNQNVLGGFYFFSHGFYMSPKNSNYTIATVLIDDFIVPSVIQKDNKICIQFHPERSGKNGLRLLQEIISVNNKNYSGD